MDMSYPANLISTFSWDAESKVQMRTYDKQLKVSL
jgi:hypothetical protein